MRIFATFKGVVYESNERGGKMLLLNWVDVCNDAGQKLDGNFTSHKTIFSDILKIGNRYSIECVEVVANKISTIINTKSTSKNRRCDVIRKANGEYHFIKGKYKGKKSSEIDVGQLHNYMLWLAKSSNNESSITNALEILKLIN